MFLPSLVAALLGDCPLWEPIAVLSFAAMAPTLRPHAAILPPDSLNISNTPDLSRFALLVTNLRPVGDVPVGEALPHTVAASPTPSVYRLPPMQVPEEWRTKRGDGSTLSELLARNASAAPWTRVRRDDVV